MRSATTWVMALGLLGLGGAASTSCGDDGAAGAGGSGAGAAGGAGGIATTPGFLESECGKCLSAACAGQEAACKAEQDCTDHIDCIDACPLGADGHVDPACAEQCPQPASSAGVAAAADLIRCWFEDSALACQACGLYDIPVPEVLEQSCPSSTTEDCSGCLGEKCCVSAQACADLAPCVTLADCIGACPSGAPMCDIACYESAPDDALEAYLEYAACASFSCSVPCNWDVSPCFQCMQAECTAPWLACELDAECWGIGVCVAGCEGDECASCLEGVSEGALLAWETSSLCRKHLCAEECSTL